MRYQTAKDNYINLSCRPQTKRKLIKMPQKQKNVSNTQLLAKLAVKRRSLDTAKSVVYSPVDKAAPQLEACIQTIK